MLEIRYASDSCSLLTKKTILFVQQPIILYHYDDSMDIIFATGKLLFGTERLGGVGQKFENNSLIKKERKKDRKTERKKGKSKKEKRK